MSSTRSRRFSATATAAPGPGVTGPTRPLSVAEQSALGRLAGWCYDHRRRVLGLWIVGIIALTAVAQIAGTRYQNNFSSGNSESQQVQNLLAARFPATAGTTADVVIHTTAPVGTAANRARVALMVDRLQTLPNVSHVTSPFAAAAHHQIAA